MNPLEMIRVFYRVKQLGFMLIFLFSQSLVRPILVAIY
ncbi:hypothetical protein FHS18_006816 [Paenibacillus phyllosphaerae]|uniref:Uncharacterized protein n=1 Tax=Paenibacillus phyllosphaerae TaxID=274593 RepID=A0A7W5FS52_9BACL|nr:hypothetical protein [Paenibacillus phyllosphaerae]